MQTREMPKLPQARMYLESARWGFETLLAQKLSGYGFRFHMIGILASLRAVQHALDAYDRTLSPEHDAAISRWWETTKDWKAIPELRFIKTARDLILKQGTFDSYATRHEHSSGGEPSTVEYDLAYYADGKRRDLERDIRRAIEWCEKELAKIEVELPARYYEEEAEADRDDLSFLASCENESDQ